MSRSGPALFALGLLLAVTLLPVAAADHAYSHRYIVYGRVIDANGDPVQGATVNLGYEPPFKPEGACAPQPFTETDAWGRTETRPVTNGFGEFIFCFHTHSMSRSLPGEGTLTVQGTELADKFTFDPFTRTSFRVLTLPAADDRANKTALSSFYTVQGRAWRPSDGETFVEGIRVYGHTVDRAPVNITFTYNGKPAQTYNTTSNNYGDFALRVPVDEKPTSGTVTIEVDGETFEQTIGEKPGVAVFAANLAEVRDPFVAKFLIGLGIVVGIAVVGGGAWFMNQRMRASREDREMRERSTRRRANK